eukprot:NODE_24_length_41419_cov_0.818780.p35 type:complete len:108 gc:universal NODE_24_length_41419_cov_0.818780:21611-21934(+)
MVIKSNKVLDLTAGNKSSEKIPSHEIASLTILKSSSFKEHFCLRAQCKSPGPNIECINSFHVLQVVFNSSRLSKPNSLKQFITIGKVKYLIVPLIIVLASGISYLSL